MSDSEAPIEIFQRENEPGRPLARRFASRPFVLLAAAALLLGLYVFFDVIHYRDYLPHGDDPAFVSGALDSPTSWFTQGYLNYFLVYPEWGTWHSSPLIKPVTNAVGYLNYVLLGNNYALHFAEFFLVQFIGLLVFVRLLRELAVPPLPGAAAITLLFLFNPAFINNGLTCLACHFDVLSGVFTLLAFLATWQERHVLALLFLTLGIFTKESAVFAPLAAALSVLIWRRSHMMSALLLLPLPLWAAARSFAYGGVVEPDLSPPASQMATGLLIWPTGLVPFDLFRQPDSFLPSSRYEIVSTVFLVANVGLWILLCSAALTVVRRRVGAPDRADLTAGLLLWTLGALSFGVLVGFGPNYGGSIYPFLYLFLATFLFSPAWRVPRWVAASVVLVLASATAVQSIRVVRLALAWRTDLALERALHDALKALPQDGRTVYVVNASRGLASAPRHLTQAWSLNLDLVIVNQFAGCTASSDAGSMQVVNGDAGMLSVRIPDCAAFNFGAATLNVLKNETGIGLKRNAIGTYDFPNGTTASEAEPLDFGRTLMLQFDRSATSITLIGYNWGSMGYDVIRRF
jgi:hypothetical protein